jgi:murein DD-endopeptidase MepM/ murein hydrolase activator NlpD
MVQRFQRAWQQATGVAARWLPDRQISLGGPSGTRTCTVGTGQQTMGILTTAMVAGWMTVSPMGAANGPTVNSAANADKAQELGRMAAQIAAMKADTAALRGTVATTADRIEARQQFLAGLLSGKARPDQLAQMLPRLGTTQALPGEPLSNVAAAGVLQPFADLEAKQMAFVDRAAATAEARLRDAQALLDRLGLDHGRFVAQTAFAAVSARRGARLAAGGPYVPASGAGADPRFAELFVNWQRVAQMEEAMAVLPSFMPVANFSYTSGFGFRYDPFHGGGANHQGVDMAGAMGEPIVASAGGTVVRAGWFGAYGNAIDVDHGRGITTRYGHLSRIDVAAGQRVAVGERIGAMGSTGRSTGTHLHFEVRVDGRPVNPRPFLESTRYVLAMQQSRVGPVLADAR